MMQTELCIKIDSLSHDDLPRFFVVESRMSPRLVLLSFNVLFLKKSNPLLVTEGEFASAACLAWQSGLV